MKIYKDKIKTKIKEFFTELLRLKGSSHSIALGLALGVFIAFTPTMGIQLALTAVICTIFRANRLAGLAAVWITNVATFVPIYTMCFKSGQILLDWTGSFFSDPTYVDCLSINGLYQMTVWQPAIKNSTINFNVIKTLNLQETLVFFLNLGGYALKALLVGCLAHSLTWGGLSYGLGFFLVKIIRKNRFGQHLQH